MCHEAAFLYRAVSFHLFEISHRVDLGSSKRWAMKSWGTPVFWLPGLFLAYLSCPQHNPKPGYSHLHFTEENTECWKAKWLAQSHQVSQSVTEPEFRLTSAWNQSLSNFHETMRVWFLNLECPYRGFYLFIYFVPREFSHLKLTSWLNRQFLKARSCRVCLRSHSVPSL